MVAAPANEVLVEWEMHCDKSITITKIVKTGLYLERPELQLILNDAFPLLAEVRVWLVDNQFGNRVLRHLVGHRIDERIDHEIVPTPPKHLLDRRREISVADIKEGRRIPERAIAVLVVVAVESTSASDEAAGIGYTH